MDRSARSQTGYSVQVLPDSARDAINITTPGFLGLGAKLVTIPEGKFRRIGASVQLSVTAEEASKLPPLRAH